MERKLGIDGADEGKLYEVTDSKNDQAEELKDSAKYSDSVSYFNKDFYKKQKEKNKKEKVIVIPQSFVKVKNLGGAAKFDLDRVN